jgi:hypothetical protein
MKAVINTVKFATTKAKQDALRYHGLSSLLSVSADAKTVKGVKQGRNTAILYMTPNYVICPASKVAQCDQACLVSAGRGIFNSVKKARNNKTDLYQNNRQLFFSALIHEIGKLRIKHGESLVVRLNGTSDIQYENITIHHNGIRYRNIFDLFSDIQFYDYTKMMKRVTKELPSNYDLTLSYSGANRNYANNVMSYGKRFNTRVAVVFKDKQLPTMFKGFKVISGDKTDLRFLDDKNVVVGLYAKGKAKKDSTGFVVDNTNAILSIK